MEIRINVDDAFIEALKKKLGEKTASQVVLDALSLFSWAASESEDGKSILSAATDKETSILVMAPLEKLKAKSQAG